MQRRGRDRAVSEAAKARLKSQERLRPPTRTSSSVSRSPSPLSSASLSPRSPASRSPTPPLTLSDQVHIAYADDDIHLAKVLLLRLQGIEVTSDSDPRIAAVKDEDFDACFIPFGRLDDGRGEQSAHLIPQPTSKQVPDATARRAEALKAKERLWETEARRFTEERCKYAALKRRTDTQRAVSIEQERVRLVKQKEAAAAALDLRRRRMKPMARTLNFALVPPVSTPPQKFTYDFPFTPRTIATPRAPTTAPPPAPMPVPRRSPNRESQQTPRQDSPPHEHGPDRVTFAQVLASMQGDLFPVLPCERTPTASRSADRTKARRQLALLDALLVAGVDLERDFNGKGKGRALNDNENPQPCACLAARAPSPASPSTSSTSSGLSRAGSWLSFGSGSRSSRSSTGTSATSVSVGTVASSWASASTILSSSPADSPPPIKSPSLRLSMGTWLPGARRTTSPSPTPSLRLCQCRHRCIRELPRVLVQVHPLHVPVSRDASPNSKRRTASTLGTKDHPQGSGHMPFTLALGRLAALARNLQAAYVRAVVVGYGGVSAEWDQDAETDKETEEYIHAGYKEEWEREKEMQRKKDRERRFDFQPPPPPLVSRLSVKREGMRAGAGDVRAFLYLASPSVPSFSPPSASTISPSSSPPPSPSSPSIEDDPLAPLALLSPLAPRSKRRMYTRPPTQTPLPARPAYPLVFAPPKPLPRSPWAPAGRGEAPFRRTTGELGVLCGEDEIDGDGDSEDEGEGEPHLYARLPAIRVRAVPNSAFLRVKALHNEALPLLHQHLAADATAKLPVQEPAQPRRPRECVVGTGVDYAPGSGLRFVYARAAAVAG